MAGARGPRGKRGGGRATGKRRIEVCSDKETPENSISQESNSKDVDFVPYRAFARFNSGATIPRSASLRSPVQNVIPKKTCRLGPILVSIQNQRTKHSKKGKNATPQRCTSKQPPEEGDPDSVPSKSLHSPRHNVNTEVIVIDEEPISGNGDNVKMPCEDDLIPNAPVTSSRSGTGDSQPIRNDNGTGTPIVETTVTAASLDNSSSPISEHIILDQPVAPVPMVITPSHQNHVDVQGPTNFIGNGLHSGCLSRANSSTSINVTELAKRLRDNDDHNEAQSAPEPGLENVWGYKVKPEFAPLLRRILDRHGDIASQTDLKSPNNLSNYLHQLCRVCEHLERTKFVQIKRAEINSMLDDVSDFERVKLNVGWLRERLEHVSRAWNGYQQYCSLKEELGNYDVSIGGLEKKLDEYKQKINDVEGELEAKRAESGQMRDLVADTKARVKTLAKQNLVDGLF